MIEYRNTKGVLIKVNRFKSLQIVRDNYLRFLKVNYSPIAEAYYNGFEECLAILEKREPKPYLQESMETKKQRL